MNRKLYVSPLAEDLCLWAGGDLLATSGNGQDSTPANGLWDDED